MTLRLLLDSHTLLWWLEEAHLSLAARSAIAEPNNDVLISAASVWELAIKAYAGKLRLPGDLSRRIEDEGFGDLSITASHGLRAAALPRHHRDPFDRMLVAQTLQEGLVLVTRDAQFAAYGVPTLPA